MGKILEYVVLLSNLSLILGGQQFNPSHANNYGREKQENFTHALRQFYPKDQNGIFVKRILPLDYNNRRKPQASKQMRRMPGLHAYGTDTIERRNHKRNFSETNLRSSIPPRWNVPPYSQTLYPRKNSKNFVDFHGEVPSQRLTRLHTPNNEETNRRHHKGGRTGRYHPRPAPKICDPCNSVPWVPLLKVPDSYRQQRTHVTELHPTPQNFNFDYHGYASNTHDVLLPPVPIVPPLEPVYDSTISSSFGLPIGNIPTSHGLLAPIRTNAIDYSSSFNYYSPHGLLENHPFPELSPVPVVPIHDSGQFYQFDSSIPDLVPPPSKNVDVSNVVLTISEENSHKPNNHKDLSPAPTGQNNFGRLEIVKSIPLAEFTASADFPHQDLPLYPPLRSELDDSNKEYTDQKPVTHNPNANLDFLVPPPKTQPEFGYNSNNTSPGVPNPHGKAELQGESSAPKPLTSSSLSWLFSDHTAPPADSKNTASVLSFATEAQEIASVVNNELRPVSPNPVLGSSTSSANAKSKKIQIIIPYTTKNKNGQDNNALESVQHEVFQPPVSKSTRENNPRDVATPALSHNSNQEEVEKKVSEMQHIIASNIRELLREEIEKAQTDQNYPLQNNIDNWTALEYSNHKTVGTKAPKEIITQALSVTSIPGTSISHLLLPSKKIPKEYFKTTPVPIFDEPDTPTYKTTNSTVNSSPFTAKPYATTNVYNPTNTGRDNQKENTPPQINHEKNYTDVGRGKVNHWGRLGENLVLPEARSKTRRIETTTLSWSSNRFVSSGSEKVHIVTPISLTTQRNYTTTAFRRTTRNIHRTEATTTETPRRKHFLSRFNSTKLEKVSNFTFNRKFIFNATTPQNATLHSTTPLNVITNSTTPQSVSSTTPIPSTYSTVTTNSTVSVSEGAVEVIEAGSRKNQTSEDLKLVGQQSINDIFPFRNKELPWESHLNGSQTVQTGRQRKGLIKQVNLPKPKTGVKSS